MIALIAPAKRLDYDSDLSVEDFSIAEHLKESKELIKELQKKSPEDLSSLMGLSVNLSMLNFERNMNWQVPKKPSNEVRQAIFAFKGDVYVGLDSETLSKSDIKYAQKNLAILSGLYGLLKPLDLMYPYRLEMGTKMKNEKGKNLYEFWGNKITESINVLAKKNNSKGIINLASVEYFTSVKTENLDLPVYSPVFKDFKNGKYKIISFFAKKARGSMARFVIQNKIKKPEDLNKFNLDGYKYSKKDSTEYSPVFLRN
ncbi:MAG: peroxide stress protein YaaA [Gammaproteobacteria bacterium]|jgi:uncharacterized protein